MNFLSNSQALLAFFVACSLKATSLILIAWLLSAALRRQPAALRHLVWTVAILSALVLPALASLLPAWHSTALGNASRLWAPTPTVPDSAAFQPVPTTIVDAVAASPTLGKVADVFLLIWFAGFVFVLFRLVLGLFLLARISSRAVPLTQQSWIDHVSERSRALGIDHPVRILLSTNARSMPLTWGIFRPPILLPAGAAQWSEDRLRIVFAHELAHITRRDWLWQVLAELSCAVYWFHPLSWLAAARLRRESECACDDSVLNSGIEPSQYANQLLELAKSLNPSTGVWSAALAFARRSNLERRFSAMLNSSIDRSNLSRRTRVALVLFALSLLVPLAAVRLPAQNFAGKFSGVVSDASGAAVPNATVIMTNQKKKLIQMTTSDAVGHFSFVGLPSGEFEMRVVKQGFAEFRAPQIALNPGQESSQNVTLEVGSVDEDVNVIVPGGPKQGSVQGGVPGGVQGGVQGGVAPNGPAGPKRIRIGGEVQAPKIIAKIQPVYPAEARTAGIQGTVILHAVIGMEGNPLQLRVMNNQIDPELARAAVEAVSKWRYRPTLLNGDPIEVDTTIKVNFTLAE